MNDIECPYCEYWNEVCHDDGQGYAEDEAHEMCCSGCRKNFVVYTFISYDYRAKKADCLNGTPHKLTTWAGVYVIEGKAVETRGCEDCDFYERRVVSPNVERTHGENNA